MIETLKEQIKSLKDQFIKEPFVYRKAQTMYVNGACQILTRSSQAFHVLINEDEGTDLEISIRVENGIVACAQKNKPYQWDSYGWAAILQIIEELNQPVSKLPQSGKSYTREGMIKRVLSERMAKADKAKYSLTYADNIYGEHTLVNEKGQSYKITLRDFKNETGYIDNPDLQTNKLGTTKHLMYAFKALKADADRFKSLSKTYPFIEIYLDPQNDYRITWHYPHYLTPEADLLISKYFGSKSYIEESAVKAFMPFIREAAHFKQIMIRPEVEEKIRKAWDNEMLVQVARGETIDFSLIKASLFPYQKEGVKFATFKAGGISKVIMRFKLPGVQ